MMNAVATSRGFNRGEWSFPLSQRAPWNATSEMTMPNAKIAIASMAYASF